MDTLAPLGMERSEAMRASIIDKPCHRSTIGFHGRISASNRKTPGKSEFCDLDPASRGRRLQSRKPHAFCVSTRQLVWSRVIGTWRIFQGVNSSIPGKTIKPAFIIDKFLVESALFFGHELQFCEGPDVWNTQPIWRWKAMGVISSSVTILFLLLSFFALSLRSSLFLSLFHHNCLSPLSIPCHLCFSCFEFLQFFSLLFFLFFL